MADKVNVAKKFQFVGGSANGRRGETIDWPLVVEASIIKSYLTEEKTAKVIFAENLPLLNEERAKAGKPAIVELPKSYTNNNAGSLLHGMRTRFLARCEKGDKDTLAIAEEFKLIEPKTQS